MLEVRPNHLSLFFGRKGTGKSDLARYFFFLFRVRPRICIDTKDEHEDALPGVPTVDSPTEVFKFQTVRAVPPKLNKVAWMDEILARAFELGDVVLWWEELNAYMSHNRCSEDASIYALQGRKRKCGLLGTSPRPADVHGDLKSQADHFFVFLLKYLRDKEAAAGHLDLPNVAALEELYAQLVPFGFLHYDVAADELVVNDPVHDPDALTAELRRLYFGPYDPRP